MREKDTLMKKEEQNTSLTQAMCSRLLAQMMTNSKDLKQMEYSEEEVEKDYGNSLSFLFK